MAGDLRRAFLRFMNFRSGQNMIAPMATKMVARMPNNEPNTLMPAPGPM